MIPFRPITPADRPLIERYTLPSRLQNCDWSFANIYCWQGLYHSECAEVEGMLFVRFRIDGGQKIGYMQPLGAVDWPQAIALLAADAAAQGEPLRLMGLTPEACQALQAHFPGRFAYDVQRGLSDYIYRRSDLCRLSGKHYQPKRNHINRFSTAYPEARFEPLSGAHFEACMQLEQEWCRQHNGCREASLQAEREAMQRAFAHFEELGLQGGALYVGERLVAFTYGSAVSDECFVIHIEKADTRYEGIFAMINRAFATSLDTHYEWINREEDMGLEGLRKAKLSYAPTHLVEKWSAVQLCEQGTACRTLWQRCFAEDEASFVDSFLARYFDPSTWLTAQRDGKRVAMAHLLPFQTVWGRVGYLYGVATDPAYQRQGLAGELIARAKAAAVERQMAALVLIPGSDTLRDFYRRHGFEGAVPIRFVTPDDFDFGTGDVTRDCAMWYFPAEAHPIPDELLCHYDAEETNLKLRPCTDC